MLFRCATFIYLIERLQLYIFHKKLYVFSDGALFKHILSIFKYAIIHFLALLPVLCHI